MRTNKVTTGGAERRPAQPSQTSTRAERKALAEFLSRGVDTTVGGRRMQSTRRTRRRFIDWQRIEDAGRPLKERRKPRRTADSQPERTTVAPKSPAYYRAVAAQLRAPGARRGR